ncbi:MAG: CehA/McbA family metallohydrolase [Chitinophagaceae bacterium]|nr:CehA/McbA family metallohydrolase [Chitinophagaceae bacterium]
MERRKFIKSTSWLAGGALMLNHSVQSENANPGNKLLIRGEKQLTGIDVFAPSCVGLNEKFRLGIKMKCQPFFANGMVRWEREEGAIDGPFNKSARGTAFMDNVMPEWSGSVTISGDDGLQGSSSFSFLNNRNTPYGKRGIRRLEDFSFNSPGFKYIRITDIETGIEGISNPIYVEASPNGERLFWGDLHCHSIFGDGIRTPEELQTFARDETFLDFFALTDHTEILSDAQWAYFKYVSNQFNEPGKFVSFNGGEWTSMSREFGVGKYGHHNFIYPGDDGAILRSNHPEENNLEKLFSRVKEQGGMVIANHPGSAGWGSNWNHRYDNEVVRLVETYNGGSHEMSSGPGRIFESQRIKKPNDGNFVVDGLKKGLKLGMIGTGDTHDGRPGDHLHSHQKTPGYSEELGPGLTGIWAEELTRESVFKALYHRRVYATTNNRTWLKFSINDHPMGAEITTSDKLKIKVIAASNINLLNIELIKDGEVIKQYQPKDKKVIWEFQEKGSANPTWYYVRLTLENEHLACSSPIWING